MNLHTARAKVLFVAALVVAASSSALSQATLTLHFVDTGQGDCTVINCPTGNNILVDCGSSSCTVDAEDVVRGVELPRQGR